MAAGGERITQMLATGVKLSPLIKLFHIYIKQLHTTVRTSHAICSGNDLN